MAKRKGLNQPAGTDSPALQQELGVPAMMPVSSWYTWSGQIAPKGTFALGKDPLAPDIEDLMFMLRHDGMIQAVFKMLTLPIIAAFMNGEWIAPTEDTGKDEVEYANKMWTTPEIAGGMRIDRSLFIRQILLGLIHGNSLFEIVKDVREAGELAGKLVIDKIAYRDPRTVRYLINDHGELKGFNQQTYFADRYVDVNVEKEETWYWAANEEMNPYYGRSYFEPAFQHYQMKRKLYYISNLAAQFAAVPGRIAELPHGLSPKNTLEIKRALAEFGFNTAMTTPPGVKVVAFNGNSTFDFQKLIDHQDTMIATSVLAKFLAQDDRTVLVDNGKADASADMFIQLLEAITAEIAANLSTRLMPMFIDYNFNSGIYPIFRFAPLTDSTKEAVLDLFATMVTSPSLQCSPEFFRVTEMKLAERLGYDIDWKEVATEEDQAAKEFDAQQKAAQKAAANSPAQPQGANSKPASGSGAKPPAAPKAPATPPTPPARLPTAIPQIKASATKPTPEQIKLYEKLIVVLSEIIDVNDVPKDFIPEGIVIPEADAEK